MSKKDLLAEAAALGIKGVDEGTLNRSLQELIDTAKANAARAEASEPVWEDIIPDSEYGNTRVGCTYGGILGLA